MDFCIFPINLESEHNINKNTRRNFLEVEKLTLKFLLESKKTFEVRAKKLKKKKENNGGKPTLRDSVT